MRGADKAGAHYAVLIDEDELANSTVCIKDLESKEAKSVLVGEF